jgi:uncharacterized protein (TIGR00255 family)
MTGVSVVEKKFPNIELHCQMQSLNRRFLDLDLNLPSIFLTFDPMIRTLVSSKISRGALSVTIRATFPETYPFDVVVRRSLAEEAERKLSALFRELGYKTIDQSILYTLLQEVKALEIVPHYQGIASFQEPLREVVEEGLVRLLEMKEREGARIEKDFEGRLQTLSTIIDEIEKKAPEIEAQFREKLVATTQMITETIDEAARGRIAQEVAFLVEKSDISEEIERFRGNLDHFRHTLSLGTSTGKTLEFILQELSREINTIGSKSGSSDIVRMVIDAKSELEKMREQVQNVE